MLDRQSVARETVCMFDSIIVSVMFIALFLLSDWNYIKWHHRMKIPSEWDLIAFWDAIYPYFSWQKKNTQGLKLETRLAPMISASYLLCERVNQRITEYEVEVKLKSRPSQVIGKSCKYIFHMDHMQKRQRSYRLYKHRCW